MAKPMSQSKATQAFSSQPARTVPGAASAGARPAHDEIARRAYEIYVKNGCKEGQCERNWLQAEKELQEQTAGTYQPTPSASRRTATPSYSARSR